MSTPLTRFAFIDALHAAEMLHVTQDTVVDWVAAGKLRSYGGKANNPFLRSGDVASLMGELGVGLDEPPKRTKSAFAKVQTRLTADSRWSEVTDDDIGDWAARADPSRRQAARQTVLAARRRLDAVIRSLDELQ